MKRLLTLALLCLVYLASPAPAVSQGGSTPESVTITRSYIDAQGSTHTLSATVGGATTLTTTWKCGSTEHTVTSEWDQGTQTREMFVTSHYNTVELAQKINPPHA